MSAHAIETLEPAILWTRFRELAAVARPPRGEQAALALLVDWAASLGLPVVSAGGSNLLVRVPATPGRERAPALVLQAHVDMVCERDSSSAYDPATGGIGLVLTDDWLGADGTTLGADDGIGVAAMQAISETHAGHGPLELLFTTAEEVGLEGAGMLDGSVVTGRQMLNLDGQKDGVLIIGCAGATDSLVRLSAERSAVDHSWAPLRVCASGALGGHSGMDIAEGRANAVKFLGRCLGETRMRVPFRLASLDGGGNRNAIPREAVALLLAARKDTARLHASLEEAGSEARAAFAATEPNLALSVEELPELPAPAPAWSIEITGSLLDAVAALPSGPLAMDPRFPGVVQTSTSLASATTRGNALELRHLTRTSNHADLADVLGTLAAVTRLAGGDLTVGHGYPPWEPRPDSPLLATCVGVSRELFGKEPVVTVAHAGLEPALIGRNVPGMDMLCVGPRIESPHSPKERISISSVQRFWRLLSAAVDSLSS